MGFTLIELLVVIAIIAVLASVLLPVLSRAKGLAQRVICTNRLKQWTLAQQLYADDNEGWIARESFQPNGVSHNSWSQVHHALAHDVWYNALPDKIGIGKASDYAYESVHEDFYYTRNQIFQCPTARFPERAAEDKVAFFSLAMNSKLILRPSRKLKLSAIQRPSATVMFLDNLLNPESKIHPRQASVDLGQPSAYANRASARHQGRVNLSFADGHVEAIPGFKVVTNGLAYFPQTFIIWTADPKRNPNLD